MENREMDERMVNKFNSGCSELLRDDTFGDGISCADPRGVVKSKKPSRFARKGFPVFSLMQASLQCSKTGKPGLSPRLF